MPIRTAGIVPGGAQVWRVANGAIFLVYDVPGSQNGARMFWHVGTDQESQALFGPTWQDDLDRDNVSLEELHGATAGGALIFGRASELANRSEHPFDTFLADFEREAQIRPWLRDPEILALSAQAMLEGRAVTEAELKTSDWWTSRNAEQREWASLVASDPESAKRRQADNRLRVTDMLRKAGVAGAPSGLTGLLADRFTTGDWSEPYLAEQVARLANPDLGTIDKDIQDELSGTTLRRSSDLADDVRARAVQYLGPVHGRWGNAEIQRWAGRLMTEDGAEDQLNEELKRQRLALFPEYENAELTYEDIAQPWRGVVETVWGQIADETDPLFERVVRLNDRGQAEALLRSEGLKRNIDRVAIEGMEALSAAFGGSAVRRAV